MCYFGSRSLFWGTGFANSNNDDSVNEILILSKSKKYSSNFQFRPENSPSFFFPDHKLEKGFIICKGGMLFISSLVHK